MIDKSECAFFFKPSRHETVCVLHVDSCVDCILYLERE